MNIENWIAAVSAAIAFASFLLSLWKAHQASESEQQSRSSAERATSAAEQAADSQQRIANALEKLESRYSNPWKVRHQKGAIYLLINDSDENAVDVEFATDSPSDQGQVHDLGALGPGEEVQFWYESVTGCDRQIVVQWRRPSETEPRQWRGHLPA